MTTRKCGGCGSPREFHGKEMMLSCRCGHLNVWSSDDSRTLKLEPSETQLFFATIPDEEVLRLDREGFHYKGEVIKDAGKAYNLFIEFMQRGLDK